MRPLQMFSDDYLKQCRKMTPTQIAEFLEDFRRLHAHSHSEKSRLISLKVPESLLNAFKTKAALKGVRYQSQIKTLMKAWAASLE